MSHLQQGGISIFKPTRVFGFLIAPIITFPGWLEQYGELLREISRLWQQRLSAGGMPPVSGPDPSFELITHRFTSRAKKNILSLFPDTDLPMDEKDRKYKYRQFGYGKYVYPSDVFSQVKDLFYPLVDRLFIHGDVQYLV